MRLVIQRVQSAQVEVAGELIAQIGPGLLVLWGLAAGDTIAMAEKLLDKLLRYRVFSDETGRMGRSLSEIQGGLLLVSQFTLLARTDKGTRPDFGPAMAPDDARELFAQIEQAAKARYPQVACGQFGADMQVSLVNDGPVTLIFDSDKTSR